MEKIIKYNTRKTFKFIQSGRSSDFIAPSFNYGCLASCRYCYMRRHVRSGLTVAANHQDVLDAIGVHATEAQLKAIKKFPKFRQTDPDYITYDIGCNEDIALHAKYLDLPNILSYFSQHEFAKSTFATKFPNRLRALELGKYLKTNKNRVRVSLMPRSYAVLLEPNTEKIPNRIAAINDLIRQGWEVHINFSPVIVNSNWLAHYRSLFQMIDKNVNNWNKDGKIKAEVIFLTHNEAMHEANWEEIQDKLANSFAMTESINDMKKAENLIWQPNIQEEKISNNGEVNIRYKHELKAEFIKDFKELMEEELPWLKIRYIF